MSFLIFQALTAANFPYSPGHKLSTVASAVRLMASATRRLMPGLETLGSKTYEADENAGKNTFTRWKKNSAIQKKQNLMDLDMVSWRKNKRDGEMSIVKPD